MSDGDLEPALPPITHHGPLGPGRAIGPYVITRELGRGGMGAVFVAHHAGLRRDVALKVVIDPTPLLHERFLREARGAAKLSHPGIVGVHDVGQDGGLPYLAMDLIKGEPLDGRIAREGRLAPLEAARIVAALADALAHAHEHGVLHRDVKPANVLMTADGRALLTDFGLAKDTHDAQAGSLTTSGELMGTPGYMAPEQADGRGKHADARADVYGLGATLYAALTGRPPFIGATVLHLISQVTKERPRPPSVFAPAVPPELDALCLRALERDPADRVATARELCQELERFRSGALPVRSPRRRWIPIGAVVGVALSSAVGLAALLHAQRVDPPPTPVPPTPPVVVVTEPPPPPLPVPVVPAQPPREETWEWVELKPGLSPRDRFGAEAACVYDPLRRAVVVVGGWGGPNDSTLADVWTWNGEEWTAVGATEGSRYVHAAAFDEARATLVLFGGAEKDKRPLDVLWTWSGGAWERPAIEGVRPGPRQWHAMVYAPDRRVVLMFGGKGPEQVELDELWEWNGARWRLLPSGEVHPPGLTTAGVVYDTRRNVLVVYGGNRGNNEFMDEVWEWNGAVWRSRGAGPKARIPAGMVFDGERTIMFGGGARSSSGWDMFDDTWSWDGETWRELTTATRPSPRVRAAMAWDPERRVVVMFGGAEPGKGAIGGTWELRPVPR